MVTHPGTPVRPDAGRRHSGARAGLRPLNLPQPLTVECIGDRPRALLLEGGRIAVERIVDEWLVEDEWWRRPLARRYLHLLLADGRPITLFQDRLTGAWYRQNYTLRAAC